LTAELVFFIKQEQPNLFYEVICLVMIKEKLFMQLLLEWNGTGDWMRDFFWAIPSL
jgi:hypothetical protein